MIYEFKPEEQQRKDREQLSLWQRVDRETYFHNLQLINKLVGVDTYEKVNEADRELSGLRYIELQKNPIKGNYDFEHLKAIHKYLFQDIYYFAGNPRDVDMEIDSITRFTSARRIEVEAKRIFTELGEKHNLIGLNKSEFCDNLASFMTDLNKLHPFREGNGRSKRAFVDQLAGNVGWSINWNDVSNSDWKYADECAFDSARDYGKPDLTYLKYNLDRAVVPVNTNSKPQVQRMSIDEFLSEMNDESGYEMD